MRSSFFLEILVLLRLVLQHPFSPPFVVLYLLLLNLVLCRSIYFSDFTFFRFSMSFSSASFTSASLFVPVHTIFPFENSRNVAFFSGSLYTRPGNCSGSYSVLSSFIARTFRFKSMPTAPAATMFWMFTCGSTLILMFIFSSDFIIFRMLSWTLSMLLAPVHTIFPELKISALVFGSFILITRPGNCSGLYSVFDSVAAIFSSGMSCPSEALTTMFTTFISRFGVFSLFAIFCL